MKMRYCFLISVVPSIIIGVVLSHFIEIWASVYVSLTSWYMIALIIFIRSSESYKKDSSKFKGAIPIILCGMLALYTFAFGAAYKGERTILFAIIIIVVFTMSFSIPLLIYFMKKKNTK